jgi:hypothetical protein
MTSDLSTTNLFLGIIALVSVLQVAGVVALAAGAIQVARKVSRLIDSVEHNQIAPAGARVQSILEDVKAVTSVLKTNFGWIDAFIGRIFGRG